MGLVRFGIVGLGNMGSFHAKALAGIKDAKLTAVCSPVEEQTRTASKQFNVPGFMSTEEFLASGAFDAVLIATPHMQHAEIALAAFDAGLHVLCEKPIAVTIGDARKVNAAAAAHPKLTFGIMLQQRTMPLYVAARQLIADGSLGELSRITWLVTDWFRTWAYYASGGWRATWAGEGGGVLINQCPHNLDLIQWVTGLSPNRVTAVASVGKTHPIEVEDEVSAILEYANGAIGHFVTTTGEAPGTNRLEVCGDRGKLVAENGKLFFHETEVSVKSVRETSKEPFAQVKTNVREITIPAGGSEGHQIITQNFVNAILHGEALIAPGQDGAAALELGSAMQMAGLTRKSVELPLDSDAFDRFFEEMKARYGGKKTLKTVATGPVDMSSSFRKP
jgi:predicted dehydrogenase